MSEPPVILEYQKVIGQITPESYSDDGLLDEHIVSQVLLLLDDLVDLHKQNVIEATSALVSIHLLDARYTSLHEREELRAMHSEEVTQYMIEGAMQGYAIFFDNLVTSGIGDIADRARREYDKCMSNRIQSSEDCSLPTADKNYMEAAYEAWKTYMDNKQE